MTPIWTPSPNFNARRLPVSILVLHYTGMENGAVALERLCDREAGVSAHYVVTEDAMVHQLVEDGQRAWHAGVSHWRGLDDINSASIGIEIVNGGHDFGLPDYPSVQIDAVIALSLAIMRRHEIAPRDVVGHSDIAPGRKADPGEHFPWQQLAKAGIGLWPDKAAAPVQAETLKPGASGAKVQALQRDLITLGYGLTADGQYGRQTSDVVEAFQRRFRTGAITGHIDAETTALIQAVRALI